MTFQCTKRSFSPPVYRTLNIESVPRRVCDRHIYENRGRDFVIKQWGTRFVLVSVARLRFLERVA